MNSHHVIIAPSLLGVTTATQSSKTMRRYKLLALGVATFASLWCGGTNASVTPTTPIEHLVIIFQENVSFDHYFGTYPHAQNTDGTRFTPADGTTSVDGLCPLLLGQNPNLSNPFRLSPSEAVTCDQDHGYLAEQEEYGRGLMNAFVQLSRSSRNDSGCDAQRDAQHPNDLVMGYYDGNTVTALWNYAQHFAISDNFYGTTFGPSTPGAINLVSGDTRGAQPANLVARYRTSAFTVYSINGSVIDDADPTGDRCSDGPALSMTGRNIGDLLNERNIAWGWFQGGFNIFKDGVEDCSKSTDRVHPIGARHSDYVPHHEPFQYYRSTQNLMHLRPTAPIGRSDQANHQYDIDDFTDALKNSNLAAVSFLKAPAYQDGHAGYSDPIAEQTFLVKIINAIQKSKFWESTAIIIAYDDSDGWYDHRRGPIVKASETPEDAVNGLGHCDSPFKDATVSPGRCGYGPRLPLVVISPYAKENYVDHNLTDQTSILKFIEDNWNLERISDDSFDAIAGSLTNMFDFSCRKPFCKEEPRKLILDESGNLLRLSVSNSNSGASWGLK